MLVDSGLRKSVLIEDVLPQRFGGAPMDYQFVEDDDGGLPRISLYVSRRVGELNEGSVRETALQYIRSREGPNGIMADTWRDGGTLSVVRAEPISTAASKVLPLHIQNTRLDR